MAAKYGRVNSPMASSVHGQVGKIKKFHPKSDYFKFLHHSDGGIEWLIFSPTEIIPITEAEYFKEVLRGSL